MSINLDPQTEQRFQQELTRGRYAEPADLINHALDVLSTEEQWTAADRARFDEFLDRRMAEVERGEGLPGDEVREVLAELRARRLQKSSGSA